MNSKGGYVYILTNPSKSTLYIGVTSNLMARVWRHKRGEGSVFTSRYNCKHLIYYESFDDIVTAIRREKQLKGWNRKWKEDLINSKNKGWFDLWEQVRDMT